MERYLISSHNYTGDAEIHYDSEGRLVRIDVSNTNMPCGMIDRFKEKVPSNVVALKMAFAGTTATIVQAAFEISFDMFWTKYNRKLNKKRTEPLFLKLSEADKVKAFYGIAEYDKFLKRENWRQKADPEKYLRDRYWENEWR